MPITSVVNRVITYNRLGEGVSPFSRGGEREPSNVHGGMVERMPVLLATVQARLSLLIDQEAGQGLAEYALILALIATVAIAALSFLGGQVNDALTTVGNSI